MVSEYSDIKFEIKGQIGIITFNRPKALNSFGGNLIVRLRFLCFASSRIVS